MATDIQVNRQAYNLTSFNAQFEKQEEPPAPSFCQRLRSCAASRCQCSAECAKQKVLGLFPFVEIMRGYQWKKWIVSDIIAGLCVGVIHIPQSMGFALLTSVPPVYGLYSSLYPILLYFLFGTSRHISVGTMAIVSILIGNIVEREAENFVPSQATNDTLMAGVNDTMVMTTSAAASAGDEELIEFKVGVAMTVTFLVGVIQLAMSFLKLGMVATFMSMSFIGGFMAGATIHIISSQIPFCLGITIARHSGIFRVPKIWYDILRNLPNVNPAELIISIICFAILISIKEVINEKFKHKMKIPIPAELLIIILGTVTSYLAKLHMRFDVRILNDIPTGLPAPAIPRLNNSISYILDSFVIAVVAFAISISLAKFFSQKYHYAIDQDQEMFAYGVMHTFSAFFGGFAGAQAPPRTMVHDSTGGKSQLASLVSALLILLVCLLLAPLFRDLPNSVLGSIIIVALIPLLKRFQDLPHMWRVNRYDCFVWIFTFLPVTFLDIDIGLAIGLGISVLTLVAETYRTKGGRLAQADKTELYAPQAHYKALTDTSSNSLYVFTFQSPLYFANIDAMKSQIFAQTIDPATLRQYSEALKEVSVEKAEVQNGSIQNGSTRSLNSTNNNTTSTEKPAVNGDGPQVIPSLANNLEKTSTNNKHSATNKEEPKPCAGVVILDCSAIMYIDLMGLNLMKSLQQQYAEVKVTFALANCNEAMQKKLVANGTELDQFVYPSLQDAVALTTGSNKETTRF